MQKKRMQEKKCGIKEYKFASNLKSLIARFARKVIPHLY